MFRVVARQAAPGMVNRPYARKLSSIHPPSSLRIGVARCLARPQPSSRDTTLLTQVAQARNGDWHKHVRAVRRHASFLAKRGRLTMELAGCPRRCGIDIDGSKLASAHDVRQEIVVISLFALDFMRKALALSCGGWAGMELLHVPRHRKRRILQD